MYQIEVGYINKKLRKTICSILLGNYMLTCIKKARQSSKLQYFKRFLIDSSKNMKKVFSFPISGKTEMTFNLSRSVKITVIFEYNFK